MNSFKDVAYQILSDQSKPLHIKEITKIALANGWLKTAGKTPEATMGAQLITDVNRLGENSRFIKTGPSTFAVNRNLKISVSDSVKVDDKLNAERIRKINENVTTKQKGDIAEARVAELVTLFGDEALACYRPISDDEGIDLIVKQKGSLKTLYIQIKSRWQDKSGSLIVDVKKKTLVNNYSMGIVVCMFDIEATDIWDYLWFIPAPDFIAKANGKADGEALRFISGKNIDRMGTWADYLIQKQDLANKLLEQMTKI